MKRGFLVFALWLICTTAGAQRTGDLVILFDNDVHCAVKGYPVMAGLRDSLEREGCHVMVVSAGDFSFGGPIGAASKGEYVVRLMNAVGYDATCLGNHEFDYGMSRLKYLKDKSQAAFLCSNMTRKDDGNKVFPSSAFGYWNGKLVAFVGVTTPSTLTSSEPSTFRNNSGKQIFDFSEQELAKIIQASVDEVKARGADIVVLLTHLGDSRSATSSVSMIEQTHGVDLVIDGHDHHVLTNTAVRNLDGRSVTLSSTGTQFQYIGMAVIGNDGTLQVRLLDTDSLSAAGCVSKLVADTLTKIEQEFEALGNRTIAHCETELIAEENTIRVCRLRETNLGDLVADAYRHEMCTDLAIVNAGGIRANITAGEVSHNMLYAVSPFDNKIVAIRTTGKDILAGLETAVSQYPKAEGCFVQVSGISFTIDTTAKPMEGRVKNVMVGDKPLVMNKKYTIAGPEYILLKGGDGFSFPSAKLIGTSQKNDLMILEEYVERKLNGVIGAPYHTVQQRIIFE